MEDDFPDDGYNPHFDHDVNGDTVFPEVNNQEAVDFDKDEDIDQFGSDVLEIERFKEAGKYPAQGFDHEYKQRYADAYHYYILNMLKQSSKDIMDPIVRRNCHPYSPLVSITFA